MSVTLSFDFKYKIKMIIAFFNLTPQKNNVKKPHLAILEKEWGVLGAGLPPQGSSNYILQIFWQYNKTQ